MTQVFRLVESPLEMKIQSYSEFQPLEEVIVGKAHSPEAFRHAEDPAIFDSVGRVLAETEEDIQELVRILEREGVRVHRPEIRYTVSEQGSHSPYKFQLQNMTFQFPNHPLMPRDTAFVYGSAVVETYTRSQNRFLENASYAQLFQSAWEQGAEWLSLPQPTLYDKRKSYMEYSSDTLLYHAANMIKCGTTVFYTQPQSVEYPTGKGTQYGLDWFKRHFADVQFVGAPCGGHADGKMALLKPGLVLCWNPDHLPEPLRGWDKIVVESKSPFPETFVQMRKERFYKDYVQRWLSEWIGYVDETVFDVNVFSVREDLVICTGYNADVFRQLEQHGVTPILWNFRHQHFWDGGVHCLTLDAKRRGPCENYF